MTDIIDKANDLADFYLNNTLSQRQAKKSNNPSLRWCNQCDNEIPELRRQALPGVTLCIACATENETRNKGFV